MSYINVSILIRLDYNKRKQTVEFFDSRGFEVNIDTFDETFHLSEEELCDGTFCFGSLQTTVNDELLATDPENVPSS